MKLFGADTNCGIRKISDWFGINFNPETFARVISCGSETGERKIEKKCQNDYFYELEKLIVYLVFRRNSVNLPENSNRFSPTVIIKNVFICSIEH